jgi:serine/threonine protein kinase/Tol biopolymer transport system component
MPLTPGSPLGPYCIVSSLGAGGMGEVYRAHDAKLHRDVAIKVLPSLFAADPDRVTRFEREAQTLAALNDPHIAHIYGLEETAGALALVMELIEGEDLARRIARGPVPIDDAIPIARQIAEALEAAHEQGIMHRDLKPANVMVRADGVVKILDFGLAKIMSAASGPQATIATMSSPTALSPAMTQIGIILGTAAYMAPEQARGKAIDRRVDVWAFGCILFEMLAGTRPFDGETVTDVLSAIVSRDPDWTALPEQTPVEIRTLLHRCLEKDPRRRLRDIGEARLICENPQTSDVASVVASPARRPKWVLPALTAALAIVALSASALLVTMRKSGTDTPRAVTRFDLQPPGNASLNVVFRPAVSVSADGSAIAFTAITEGVSRIYIRSRMDVDIHVVPGTDGGSNPSLSPDGKWVAFFVDGSIRKSSVDGAATTIGRAGDNRGIAWSDDGALIFPLQASGPLVRMSADGGEQRPITTIRSGERTHRWPDVLPGGKAVLFTVGTLGSPDSYDASNIEAVLLATGERRVVIKGAAMARYCGDHLVYSKGPALFAAPFDPERLSTTGPPVQIVAGVERDSSTGAAHFDCANDGTLAFIPGSPVGDLRRLVWVDQQGQKTVVGLTPGPYQEARVSPDGTRAVLLKGTTGGGDVWTYDFSSGTLNRLTFTSTNAAPMWSADGKMVYYTAFEPTGASSTIMRKVADGSREAEVVRKVPGRAYLDWIDDRQTMAIIDSVNAASDRGDLLRCAFDPAAPAQALVSSAANEYAGSVSPGGRWLAYESDETDRLEVHVRDLTGTGAHWQVTTAGGEEPRWSADGREMVYRIANRLVSIPLVEGTTFQAGKPRPLFDALYNLGIESGRSYDVDPKTGRFLIVVPADGGSTSAVVRVVLNWDAAAAMIGK